MGLLVNKGWLYCALWYSSILAGYAGLFCPLLPILLISNRLYRYCTDALFTFWQYYPTVLLETLCACEVQVTGDPVLTTETSLLVMNHRTRTDWNFFWPAVYHCVEGPNKYRHPTKFVLKDIIRHIPGPGWVMQLACFVYIRRCWSRDKITLRKAATYFTDLNYKYSLMVFPEGTDLTADTKRNSDIYAEKMQLQTYDHVLHPRTTGFAYLARHLLDNDGLDAVYDVTLVYPDTVPQNERVLLRGEFPKQVKVHLAKYPCGVLPRSEQGLREFLERRWLEKEQILKEYHATGRFLHGRILKRSDRPWELRLALYFWTVLPLIVLYCFLFVDWFRHMVIAHTVFLVFINVTSDGFQSFEIALYNFKKKVFGHSGWGASIML